MRGSVFRIGAFICFLLLAVAANANAKPISIDKFPLWRTAGVIDCGKKGASELLIPRGTYLKPRKDGWIILCEGITFVESESTKNKKKFQSALASLESSTEFRRSDRSPNIIVGSSIVIKAKSISGSGVIVTYEEARDERPTPGESISGPAGDGSNGNAGSQGRGAKCRLSGVKSSTGGGNGTGGQDGYPGAHGFDGQSGANGKDAHRVDIIVKRFAKDSQLAVHTVGQNGQPGAKGGDGQAGGKGGDGGRGGKGGNAASCKSASGGGNGGNGGPGGNGGNGGNGGDGGHGGHGGNVSIQGTVSSVEMISVYNSGGVGGDGGLGGSGGVAGKGGLGGAAGCGGDGDDGWLRINGAGSCGSHGSNGGVGKDGQPGRDGVKGDDGKKGQTLLPTVRTFTPSVLDKLFFEGA